MILQGFPVARLPKTMSTTPDMLLQDLAGNAMASTILLAIFASLFESALWRSPPLAGSMEDADVAHAMEIFEIGFGSLQRQGNIDDDSDHEFEPSSSSSLVAKRRKR